MLKFGIKFRKNVAQASHYFELASNFGNDNMLNETISKIKSCDNINVIYKLLFDYCRVQAYKENVLAIIYCWAVFKYGLSTNVNNQEADRYYRILSKKYPISECELIVMFIPFHYFVWFTFIGEYEDQYFFFH